MGPEGGEEVPEKGSLGSHGGETAERMWVVGLGASSVVFLDGWAAQVRWPEGKWFRSAGVFWLNPPASHYYF